MPANGIYLDAQLIELRMLSWLNIDKAKLAVSAERYCKSAAVIAKCVTGVMLVLIPSAFTISALGFVLRYVSDDFCGLLPNEQTNILVELQYVIVPRAVLFAIVFFALQVISEILAAQLERRIGSELDQLRGKVKKFSKKIEKIKYFSQGIGAFIKLYFDAAAKKSGVGDQERLSFYIREKNSKKLWISDRYASNEDYQAILRETYSVGEGIIREAARKGSACLGELPDYDVDPEGYIRTCKDKFEMKRATVQALSMKARFYYAFRFSSHDNQRYNSMVVIESMNPKFSTKNKLDEVFSTDNEFIHCLVDTFFEQIPRLKISKKGKF